MLRKMGAECLYQVQTSAICQCAWWAGREFVDSAVREACVRVVCHVSGSGCTPPGLRRAVGGTDGVARTLCPRSSPRPPDPLNDVAGGDVAERQARSPLAGEARGFKDGRPAPVNAAHVY